jgi:hypothetical protein
MGKSVTFFVRIPFPPPLPKSIAPSLASATLSPAGADDVPCLPLCVLADRPERTTRPPSPESSCESSETPTSRSQRRWTGSLPPSGRRVRPPFVSFSLHSFRKQELTSSFPVALLAFFVEHGSYGAFFKDISDAPAPKKIKF